MEAFVEAGRVCGCCVRVLSLSLSGKSKFTRSFRLMQRITRGTLRVLSVSHIYSFPPVSKDDIEKQGDNPDPDLRAELRVVKDSFWLRLCAMGDLGFAEAYMYGDVECDDLVSLFSVRINV